jgi:acetyl esterase/lipase
MHLPRPLRFQRARAALTLGLLGLAIVPTPAAANVPDPVAKTLPVRVAALGNTADGSLTTTVTYTDTTASARSSSGNTVGLNKGYLFRLRTCVAYHLSGTAPVSSCAERTVDTRANTAAIFTRVPTVTLSGQPRPATQPWGYFKAYAEVLYQSGGSWPLIAHSWPDNGLQGAGIAVAAQDQTTGTLPPNSAVRLDGAFTSAINSGQPDSICSGETAESVGSLPPGVSTSDPAFSGAPAYYEVGLPTGDHAGQAPRGLMLVIHGGSWVANGSFWVQTMRADADRWRARGWETVNLSYRACGQSLGDVLWFYDSARSAFGAATICALGTSAGGHLALLIGANRPDLYCAVSQAGPTDLSTIQSERAYNPATGLHDSTLGGRLVHNLGAAAFGEENLPAYSPAAQASATLKNTRVLQAFSADDAFVPYQQAADLGEAMSAANPAAYVDNLQLAIGTIPFGHGLVTQAALDDFRARERRLVAPITAPTVPLDRR